MKQVCIGCVLAIMIMAVSATPGAAYIVFVYLTYSYFIIVLCCSFIIIVIIVCINSINFYVIIFSKNRE